MEDTHLKATELQKKIQSVDLTLSSTRQRKYDIICMRTYQLSPLPVQHRKHPVQNRTTQKRSVDNLYSTIYLWTSKKTNELSILASLFFFSFFLFSSTTPISRDFIKMSIWIMEVNKTLAKVSGIMKEEHKIQPSATPPPPSLPPTPNKSLTLLRQTLQAQCRQNAS